MAGQKFNSDNPLPYGGTTDIHGNILQAVTKEEHDAMLAKARKAFGKKERKAGKRQRKTTADTRAGGSKAP